MKKYNVAFPFEGQGIVGRINYLQKCGVVKGLIELINSRVNFFKYYSGEYPLFKKVDEINIIIPTPNDARKVVTTFPSFEYNGRRGYVDMINVNNNELIFHIMFIKKTTDESNDIHFSFENGHWHDVREVLNLEDVCTLYEYIEDRKDELVLIHPDKMYKYMNVGAVGAYC